MIFKIIVVILLQIIFNIGGFKLLTQKLVL